VSEKQIPTGPCLWVFGDSYATEANAHYNYTNRSNWVWTTRLAKLLGFKRSAVVAQYGVSNEWIMSQIKGYKHHISPEDVVVIVSSGMGRRWFFKHSPELSNFASLWNTVLQRKAFWKQDRWDGKGKQVQKAIDYYLTYLADENPILEDAYMEMFLAWCYQARQWGQWRNMILLAGFEAMPLHSGNQFKNASLFDIDGAEIDKDNIKHKQEFLKHYGFQDPRIMHLSRPNHEVMAQKLYENIANNVSLDFTTEFEKNLYLDKSTWKTPLLSDDEFNFGGETITSHNWIAGRDEDIFAQKNVF
jgi:hypothetical protein